MIITDYQLHNEQELLDIMRRTCLAGDNNILPFKDSKITLQTVSYADVIPTQTFVLTQQLARIHNIRTQMMQAGIDIFGLRGFLSYKTLHLDSTFIFTPPIIEIVDNQPIIIDGQHRITYAKDNNIKFNALIIENIPSEVYPYQLPIPGGWDAVQRFDNELPKGFVRKQRRYSTPEMKKYFFREYQFPGILKIMRAHTGTREGR